MVTVLVDTVQTAGVSLAIVTSSDEVAVAVADTAEVSVVTLPIAVKSMV